TARDGSSLSFDGYAISEDRKLDAYHFAKTRDTVELGNAPLDSPREQALLRSLVIPVAGKSNVELSVVANNEEDASLVRSLGVESLLHLSYYDSSDKDDKKQIVKVFTLQDGTKYAAPLDGHITQSIQNGIVTYQGMEEILLVNGFTSIRANVG